MQGHKIRLVTKKITFKPVGTLSDILAARRIRNECRTYLTNNTNYIGIPQQIWWYLTYYRRAAKKSIYRMFIARNKRNIPVGYGALYRHGKELLVTECVAEDFRHRGYGQAILGQLIKIAENEKRVLVAEIRDTNKNSIALHEKYGFKLKGTKQKSDFKLRVYKI